MQLSSEVARLRRMLNQTDAQSELSDGLCVCVGRGGEGRGMKEKAFTYLFILFSPPLLPLLLPLSFLFTLSLPLFLPLLLHACRP